MKKSKIHLLQSLNPQGNLRSCWTNLLKKGESLEEIKRKHLKKEWRFESNLEAIVEGHCVNIPRLGVKSQWLCLNVDLLDELDGGVFLFDGKECKIDVEKATLVISEFGSTILVISLFIHFENEISASELPNIFEKNTYLREDVGVLHFFHATAGGLILNKINKIMQEISKSCWLNGIRFDFGDKIVHSIVVSNNMDSSSSLSKDLLSLDLSPRNHKADSDYGVHFGWSFTFVNSKDVNYESFAFSAILICQSLWFFSLHVESQGRHFSRALSTCGTENRKFVMSCRQSLESLSYNITSARTFLLRTMRFSADPLQNMMESLNSSWHIESSMIDFSERISELIQRSKNEINDLDARIANKQNKALYIIASAQVFVIVSFFCDYLTLKLYESESETFSDVGLISLIGKIGLSLNHVNEFLLLITFLSMFGLVIYGLKNKGLS